MSNVGKLSSRRSVLRDAVKHATEHVERRYIEAGLDAHHWNRRQVAKDLGISYRALLYKMRQLGIGSNGNHNDSSIHLTSEHEKETQNG